MSSIVTPVQRTETSQPATLMVRSCGEAVVVVGVAGVRAGESVGVAEGVGVATRVGDAEEVGVPSVSVGWPPNVGVLKGARGSVLTLASVMSRPALSMANHAVADTPATAASQMVAMPTAERRLITIWSLCHLAVPRHHALPRHARCRVTARRSVLSWQQSC